MQHGAAAEQGAHCQAPPVYRVLYPINWRSLASENLALLLHHVAPFSYITLLHSPYSAILPMESMFQSGVQVHTFKAVAIPPSCSNFRRVWVHSKVI